MTDNSAPQMTPQQQNAIARMNLLQTGISMVKRLQPVVGALGAQVRVPLLRMGIMTGVLLQFSCPVTISVAATASPVAPWNIAQSVTYTDFAGVNRTKTNGFQLWAAQSMKMGDALSTAPAMNFNTGAGPSLNYNTNVLNQPTSTAGGTIYFSLYVPMAYDPANDLTGAILTQTNVGEHYITVQLCNALVNTDPWIAPYTSGTVAITAANVTIEAFQYYIQPQNMTAANLPVIDLSTVYGFEGGYQSTANIATGQSTFINYPNNRSILSTLVNYENNSIFTLNETDVSLVVVLANSNTNFMEQTPRLIRETMRNIVNSDMPSGTYYLGSRRQPIMTQQYAQVQARFDITTANAGVTQLISQYEVQYPSGSALPGIVS